MSFFSKGKPTKPDSPDSSELYRLRADNERLRRRLRLVAGTTDGGSMNTLGTNSLSGVPKESFSLAIKEFGSVSVDRKLRIVQLNTFTAELFNTSKEACQGALLAELDRSSHAPEVLTTLLLEAQHLPAGMAAEHEAEWSPTHDGGARRWMHFKAVWQGDTGTVVIQDVTLLRQTRTFFERLVSPHIVNQLMSSVHNPVAPQHRTISLVFGDLRGFTTFCNQAQSLDAVSRVCNDLFEMCSRCLKKADGTLDKFVGDEVMALFGAPIDQTDHACRAVHFAIMLQQEASQLRARWIADGVIPPSLIAEKPDVLKLGVGVNTARLIVGLFGNDQTGQYTALGHGVNLCARLCSAASGGQILATRETMDALKTIGEAGYSFPFNAKFRRGEPMMVKGVAAAVEPVSVEWE